MGAWLAAGGWNVVSAGLLIVLVIAAAFVDVRQHRIPNVLVFSGVAIALLLAHLPGGSVQRAVGGIAVGMAMGLPLYWLRAMGAGDVKLMGMAGGFLGGVDMFAATLAIFMVGGVLGLVVVARRRAFGQLAINLRQMVGGRLLDATAGSDSVTGARAHSVGVQPYGVAIAVGIILYLAVVKGGIFA